MQRPRSRLAASARRSDGSGADQSSVGATDSSGSYTSNDGAGAPVVASASPALEMLEPSLHQNLNADGVIGVPTTVIEARSSATSCGV